MKIKKYKVYFSPGHNKVFVSKEDTMVGEKYLTQRNTSIVPYIVVAKDRGDAYWKARKLLCEDFLVRNSPYFFIELVNN